MLFFSLIVSGLLLLVVNGVALRRDPKGIGSATLLSFAAAVPLFFCLQSVPLIVNALAVALGGAACWAFRARLRWFLVSSLVATAAAYGLMAGWFWVQEGREWDRLKAAYPMESLAPRLAYEDRPQDRNDTVAPKPERLSALESRLIADQDNTVSMRTNRLEYLHAGTVAHFVNSPGFGIGRRPFGTSPEYVEWAEKREANLDSPGPIPQPSGLYNPPEPGAIRVGNEPGLGDSHETNLVTFLDPFNFGYVRDRDHVAGFRPHRFRKEADAPQRWKVERLELVGLLKYDEPVVYLSENLPGMDELRDAPTRPLDAFESEALAKLRRGDDLMVQDRPDRMRALGSIRAVKQCLHCHNAERGELLGAFSYRLVRDAVKD